jgi:cell division transport system permease protein
MMGKTIKQVVKSGLTGFRRNLGLSLTATFIMTLTLIIVSIILILYAFTNTALDVAKNQVGGVTAYFHENIAENDVNSVKAEIELMPKVKHVTYTSSEAALEKFKKNQELKSNSSALEALKQFGPNEIILPASLTIVTDTLDDYDAIFETLATERFAVYFDEISDNKKVINGLNSLTKTIQTMGIVVVAIFVLITTVVIFNTIRLAIFNRRDEVEIMRLVGATNSYIRAPLFIESMIYAFIGTLVTFTGTFIFFAVFSEKIDVFFGIPGLTQSLKTQLLWQAGIINLVLSSLLGIVSSSIAMRRYLRI